MTRKRPAHFQFMQAKNQQSSGLSLDRSIWNHLSEKAALANISRHKLISDILKEYINKNPLKQPQELV